METKKELRNQLAWIENNTAWRWQIERLQSEISTLKNVLIETGILINSVGVHKTIIVIDGEAYSIKPKEKR